MRVRILLALGCALASAGCGYYDTRSARDPLGRSSLVGRAFPDLADCMGPWGSVKQTKPDEAIVTWERTDNSTGLEVNVTLIGSVKIGGSGGCKMTAVVLRDGTVADVTFPGSYADGVLTAPYAACAPLVSECLSHPGRTGLPLGYDAFAFLLPDAARKP